LDLLPWKIDAALLTLVLAFQYGYGKNCREYANVCDCPYTFQQEFVPNWRVQEDAPNGGIQAKVQSESFDNLEGYLPFTGLILNVSFFLSVHCILYVFVIKKKAETYPCGFHFELSPVRLLLTHRKAKINEGSGSFFLNPIGLKCR
jgi:hypothetical protein